MKIYTSYFGNSKKLAEANVLIINIARFRPRFISCPSLLEVAPSAYMVKGDITREEYISLYEENILKPLNIEDFIKKIIAFSGGKDVALCCYEKPSDFCHRHLLADWIEKKGGLKIEEFESHPEERLQKHTQLNLFK